MSSSTDTSDGGGTPAWAYILCSVVVGVFVHLIIQLLRPSGKNDKLEKDLADLFSEEQDEADSVQRASVGEGSRLETMKRFTSVRKSRVLDVSDPDDDTDDDTDDDADDEEADTETTPGVVTPSTEAASEAAPEAASEVASSSASAVGFVHRTDAGPHTIGDRIILKGLVAAKHLNGMHGHIADVWNDASQRYPVALDLVDQSGSAAKLLSVKVSNLLSEPALSAEADRARCDTLASDEEASMQIMAEIMEKNAVAESPEAIARGCINADDRRVLNFLFEGLRHCCSGTLKGEKNLAVLQDFQYFFWKTQVYQGFRTFLLDGTFEKDNDLDKIEKQLNPDYNPAFNNGIFPRIRHHIMTPPCALQAWNVRIEGEFWVVGLSMFNPQVDGTFVVPVTRPTQVYCILSYKGPLATINAVQESSDPHTPSPITKLYLTIVPWYGRLIHDPMVMPMQKTQNPNELDTASTNLAKKLRHNVDLALFERRVITRFAQLEVPDGSRDGLTPNRRTTFNDKRETPDFSNMEPLSAEETRLVEQIAQIPAFPVGAGAQNPLTHWNILMAENNTQGGVILAANNTKLAQFVFAAHGAPTAVEVVTAMHAMATKLGRRPATVGVERAPLVLRMQFLFMHRPDPILGVALVKKNPPPDAAPVSADERRMVEAVADHPPFPALPNGAASPMGTWHFLPKPGDPRGVLVQMLNQSVIHRFDIKEGGKPTALELGHAMLEVVAKMKKRPSMIGVYDAQCCGRLQFLFMKGRKGGGDGPRRPDPVLRVVKIDLQMKGDK